MGKKKKTNADKPSGESAIVKNAETGEASKSSKAPVKLAKMPVVEEVGGPTGPDPTRYGDWERKRRCVDF